jgi:integrase
VTIEINGDRLCLRGTFPPKPKSQRTKAYQQRLSLGIHANIEGVKLAEQKAREVGVALDAKTFDWTAYQKNKQPNHSDQPKTTADWVKEFESDYFQKRSRTPTSKSTYKDNYLTPFNKLPGSEQLTEQTLINTVLKTKPDSSTRLQTVKALTKLGQFAGLAVDLSEYRGSYSVTSVNPRDLPSDPEIAKCRLQLADNPVALWVYGMMAAYGLRNHEIFHLDLSNIEDDGEIQVLNKTKTGFRKVWPCFPEWVEMWNLGDPFVPEMQRPVESYKNKDLGAKVYSLLKAIPFTPYNLRHAWARRTFEYGWNPEMAAHMMGHSLTIHIKTYHAWIGDDPYREAFNRLSNRTDRPLPPLVE